MNEVDPTPGAGGSPAAPASVARPPRPATPPHGDRDRMAVLERRVAALERRARARRLLTALLALALVVVATTRAPVRILQAESFVLRGPDGGEAASLTLLDGGPALSMYDADGRLRVALAVEPEGALLNFFTPAGAVRLVVGERGDGALVVLRDGEGAPRAAIAVRDATGPSLYLLDADLTPLFRKP